MGIQKMNENKEYIFTKKIIIYFIFFILNMSCTPSRLSKVEKNKITSKPHGFIIFDFNSKALNTKDYSDMKWGKHNVKVWNFEFEFDDKILFNGRFKSNSKYKIPIPVGKQKFFYRITGAVIIGGYYDVYKSGKININVCVKKNQIIYMKLVRKSDPKWGIGCVPGYGAGKMIIIPWPKIYQEVAFEIKNKEN